MKTVADLNTQPRRILRNRRSTANRPRRTIKDRQYTILDDVNLTTAEPFDLFRNVSVQPSQQVQPTILSEPLHMLLDADDSSDQHRRQYRIRLSTVTHARQKLFHLVENRILIADKRK